MRKRLLLFALLLAASALALEPPPQIVVAPPVPVLALVPRQTCDVTATASGGSAFSVSVPSAQYLYICSIYIAHASQLGGDPGAAGPSPTYTTSGLRTNLVWWGSVAAASQPSGVLGNVVDQVFFPPLKTSVPGTSFIINVSSIGGNHFTHRISLTGYYAP